MAKNKTVTCNPENAGTKYTPPVSKIRLIKIRSKIICVLRSNSLTNKAG